MLVLNVLVLQGWLGRTPLLPCRYFVHSLASKVGGQPARQQHRGQGTLTSQRAGLTAPYCLLVSVCLLVPDVVCPEDPRQGREARARLTARSAGATARQAGRHLTSMP